MTLLRNLNTRSWSIGRRWEVWDHPLYQARGSSFRKECRILDMGPARSSKRHQGEDNTGSISHLLNKQLWLFQLHPVSCWASPPPSSGNPPRLAWCSKEKKAWKTREQPVLFWITQSQNLGTERSRAALQFSQSSVTSLIKGHPIWDYLRRQSPHYLTKPYTSSSHIIYFFILFLFFLIYTSLNGAETCLHVRL